MACMQRCNRLPHRCKLLLQCRSFAQVVTAAEQQHVTLHRLDGADEGVTVLNLNRPKQKNALSVGLARSLGEAVDSLSASDARVVIIKSSVPGVFCAGADLKERLNMSHKEAAWFSTSLRSLMTRISNLPMPTIAAIDGLALGGGLELALACDMRMASATAKLGLVETRLAIMPGAGGTVRLPRLINPALAKEMIFTAKVIDGSQAEYLGLVNHAVKDNEPGDGAYQKSLEIAREILPNGPIGIKAAKFSVSKGFEVDIGSALAIEEACYAQTIQTKDRVEGLKAFAEKRPPKYIGQ